MQTIDLNQVIEQLLVLLNDGRARAGLPTLSVSATLTVSAQTRALLLASSDSLQEVSGPETDIRIVGCSTPKEVAQRAFISLYNRDDSVVAGENAWANTTLVGMDAQQSRSGGVYICLMFEAQ